MIAGIIPHQRTNLTMSEATRNRLVRILADIDRLLPELEDIAQDPQDDDRDRALAMLIGFQEAKRGVEAKLRRG